MKKIEAYEAHVQTGILLNANEVSDNLDQVIKDEIKEMIDRVEFNRYPDDNYTKVLNAYSNYIGIDVDQILCGNGSDQMLDLIMSYYLSKGKKMLTLNPDFGMYDFYASRYDGEVIKYVCREDGSFDVDDFIKFGKENDVDLIIFSNPNNPSGNYLENKDVLKIVEAFKDIPFIDDEAYVEFAKESMVNYVNVYPNFFVLRTLSKIFGLAAIRTGFLLGPKDKMANLRANKVPYALNTLSQEVASICLKYTDKALRRVKGIVKVRETLLQKEYKNITIYPSEANFVMVRATNLELLKKMFEERDIVIRTYGNRDYVRITIGNEEENKMVFDVLDTFDKEA